MMPPGGSERAKRFAMFAILGTLEGKTPEQLADEYMEQMGWSEPAGQDEYPLVPCLRCHDYPCRCLRDEHEADTLPPEDDGDMGRL